MSIGQSDQPESKTSTSRRRVLLAGAGVAALPLITAAAGGASNQPSVTPVCTENLIRIFRVTESAKLAR